MKQILNLLNGGVTLVEDGGKVTLSINESLGGGAAAGVLKGSGSIILDGEVALQLGEKLLNSHLPPTMLPFAQAIEGVANSAIKALE